MATLFQDLFNRADGAPGNGWTVDSGTWDIATNQLRGHVAGSRIHRSAPVGGTVDSVIELVTGPSFSYTAGASFTLYFRSDLARGNCYYVQLITGPVGTATLTIGKAIGGTGVELAAYHQFAFSGGTHTLRFQALGTLITADLDGSALGAASDGDIAGGDYIHMYTVPADKFCWDAFTVYDAAAAAITIAPTQVRPGSVSNQLTVYGEGSTWTPGEPGSPVFTVDVGTITYQEILTGTSAVVTYDAPAVPGLATFTDPDNGAHALVAVTNSPLPSWLPASEPTGLLRALIDFSQAFGLLVNPVASAVYDALELSPNESILGYVRGLGTPEEGHTLAADLAAVLAELAVDSQDPDSIRHIVSGTRDGVTDTLADMLALTSQGSYSLSDVLTAISGVGGGALTQDDLDALQAAIMGDPATAIRTIAEVLATIQTVHGYTLGDLVDVIGGLAGDDVKTRLAGLLSAIQALPTPATEADLDDLLAEILGVSSKTVTDAYNRASDAKDSADAAKTAADAATLAVGAAVLAIGGMFTAQAATIGGYITAATAEVNGAIAAAAEALGGEIAGLGEAIASVGSAVGTANGKLDDLLAAVALLRPTVPVWPGASKVTLGDPVEIAGSQRVTVPMNGCILELTVVPSRRIYWSVDGLVNVERAGFLTFIADNGAADARQAVAWSSGVYMPKGLLSAAGIVLYLPSGVSGTLTPWVYK